MQWELLSNLAGKQRTKKEASQNTNRHNPGGHERKILQKLRNAERNNLTRPQRLAKQKLTNWLSWRCDSLWCVLTSFREICIICQVKLLIIKKILRCVWFSTETILGCMCISKPDIHGVWDINFDLKIIHVHDFHLHLPFLPLTCLKYMLCLMHSVCYKK